MKCLALTRPMSRLTIYKEDDAQTPLVSYSEGQDIAEELAKIKVNFERWQAKQKLLIVRAMKKLLLLIVKK